MKDYERITSKDLIETITTNDYETKYVECLHRLWELENKIEKGELVEVKTETATKTKLRDFKRELEIKEETIREIYKDYKVHRILGRDEKTFERWIKTKYGIELEG